jgi:hypothetical protein
MFCEMAMPETRARGKEFGIEARKHAVVSLIDDASHQDRDDERERHAPDADRVERR